MAGVFDTWWAVITAGVGPTIDGATIRFLDFSEAGQYGQGAPPAVHYRFLDDNYEPTHGIRRGVFGPDALYACMTRLAVHIWGATPEQVHELRRRVIVAHHNPAHGNYRVEGGAWNTGDVVSKRGASYVFPVAWDIPIVRDEETTAVVNAMPDDVGIKQIGS